MAASAEIAARRASRRVECEQAGVERGFIDAPTARLSKGQARIEPCGDTAVDQSVAVIQRRVDFGVVPPALRAALRIEGDDLIRGGGEEQRAVDENWCRLEA